MQQYRSLDVAVKEFLPRSLVADVKAEASILASLSHPYVPFLFGICTKELPLRIIMQYHTVYGQDVSTLERELHKGGTLWIILCAQLMEALHYLHEEVNILHNDIKGDNVLLASALKPEEDCQYQIVLIDFGKATKINQSKHYVNLLHSKKVNIFASTLTSHPKSLKGSPDRVNQVMCML